MAASDPLKRYREKRDFNRTPEPSGVAPRASDALSFVIQKHWASSLHYDFRLEFEGTLKSWAVPKGPSLDPQVKRMAVEVEDHPLAYAGFEGTIPPKQYGAGRVIVWDRGTWQPLGDAAAGFAEGKLKFELHGHKLRGRWTLVRMHGKSADQAEKQPPWLLIKEHDAQERPSSSYDVTEALPDSVLALSAPANPPAAAAEKPKRPATGKAAAEQTKAKTGRSGSRRTASFALPQAAVPSPLPATLSPQLATLVDAAPQQGQWVYELKFDGYRLLTRIDGQTVACITRNGHDWTAKMPALAKALRQSGLDSAWLDGEIVVADAEGVPNFQLLQNAFKATDAGASAASAAITYFLFDLPFFAGHDLRPAPLAERRALLERLLTAAASPLLRFSQAFDAPAGDLVASACGLGFEGLIGKRAESHYASGRSAQWIKLKCGKRQEFVICGYTAPRGTRTALGALVLGLHDAAGTLRYAGNVGSGFTEQSLQELHQHLLPLHSDKSPFGADSGVVGRPQWVQPVCLAEVSFADWTASGRVRHAVFRGMRSDKSADAITREVAVKAPASGKARTPKASSSRQAKKPGPATPAAPSLRITHPERVIDSASGVTKRDLVDHYARVAALIQPHLDRRPVALVRAPAGVAGSLFFQKHAGEGEVPGVRLLDPALDPGHDPLIAIDGASALLSAAQMNMVELHTWNATADRIALPDRMAFDLDPGEGLDWPAMQQAALLVRTMLLELKLSPFLKTSGGKGLHVVVPLQRKHGWDTVKDFSHAIVDHLARTLPDLFVAKSGPKNRVGKIFVDYLRNGFGATTACAWSARARPGMGVSVPVAWEELDAIASGSHWTVATVQPRLAKGDAPWAAYGRSACKLDAAMKTLGFKPA
jgi:bifunctional non-homologous end joining protein LigD